MMKKNLSNLLLPILCAVCIMTSVVKIPVVATCAVNDGVSLREIIERIIEWEKKDSGVTPSGSVFTPEYLTLAGSLAGDWFPFGIGRYGYEEGYDAYLAAVADYIIREYKKTNKLGSGATEWHRIALAVGAAGGDPTAIGSSNGAPVNLIADGIYNRENIGRQGINGFIWGLIALDSKRYEVPEGAVNTRESIIAAILEREIDGGGFALTGVNPDPSITGMAIQALSPYYDGRQDLKDVVDRSITWLSNAQEQSGDYYSWGSRNVSDTVWPMLALISLGIDPLTDARFIKNGNTLLDGILKYRNDDGGFRNSETGVSNSMASEQVLYGLAGLYRFQNGMNNLFDLRDVTERQKPQNDEKPSAWKWYAVRSGITIAAGAAAGIILRKKKNTVQK